MFCTLLYWLLVWWFLSNDEKNKKRLDGTI